MLRLNLLQGLLKQVSSLIIPEAELEAENKAKAVNDIDSEEYKLEMRKELRSHKKVVEEEDKLLAFYQQEREKINYNWIISKKELDDKKSELINKDREV